MTAKELRETRAPVAVKVRELADRSNDADHDWSAEDEAEWKRINAEYDTLTRQIEITERTEEVEGIQRQRVGDQRIGRDDAENRPGGDTQRTREETRALAMQGWFRAQSDLDLEEQHVEACREVGLNPARRNLDLSIGETRGVQTIQRSIPHAWSPAI